MNGTIQDILFSFWTLALSIMILRPIKWLHVSIVCCFIAERDSTVGYTGLFIHSSVDGLLGCFQFLAITNKAARTICVQVFVQIYIFPR